MRKLIIITIGLLFFVFLESGAQTKNTYSIFFKGKKIGSVTATLDKTGTKEVKDLKTVSDAKVVFVRVHIETEVKAIFENGELTSAIAYKESNRSSENVHASTTMKSKGEYALEKNGVKETKKIQPISYCIVDLYFKEPKGLSNIYSTMHASYVKIAQKTIGMYEITNPDGKKAIYSYKNGNLITIEIDTPVGKVTTKKG